LVIIFTEARRQKKLARIEREGGGPWFGLLADVKSGAVPALIKQQE
jgi:hypothetical protein